MIKQEDVYKIGRIGRPHGVKGEMLMMFSDDVFDQTDADYLILKVDGIFVPFFIEEYRFKTDETIILKLEDIDSKEQAQTLTNSDVFFPRKFAEESDHYSWSQLVGYTVQTEQEKVGRVKVIDTTTENYLFVVDRHGEELLIPAVDEFVADIDHTAQTIHMKLPEGLI